MKLDQEEKKLDIDVFITNGVKLLRQNMEKYPSFDPEKPYDEKNEYFRELAERGERELFRYKLHWVAELYFKELLDEILTYERMHNKHFNKGMAFANLGIAQMAIGKFDIGIAHLLTAGEEDQPINPDYDILNTRLWEQFEKPIIFDYLIEFNRNSDADVSFMVDEIFLNKLFREMDQQDRIFIEGTIWMLRDNLHQNSVFSNAYTRGRLYSGLKDLSLLTETLLRKKQKPEKYITLGGRGNQPGLVTNALTDQEIDYPQDGLNPVANNIQDFLKYLEQILNDATSAKVRRLYCLLLVRNFTGHHFDVSETVTSPKGKKTFFEMYETVLINILSAVLYFKHIDAI